MKERLVAAVAAILGSFFSNVFSDSTALVKSLTFKYESALVISSSLASEANTDPLMLSINQSYPACKVVSAATKRERNHVVGDGYLTV